MTGVSWGEFAAAAPDLAAAGQPLLYQFGPGLGFLATVRGDGGPRLHPVCPFLHDSGLYVFVVPSPKQEDLLRDGRYALHSFPPEDRDDEFYVTGQALAVLDPERIAQAAITQAGTGIGRFEPDVLFELRIERVLHAAYGPRGPGSFPPRYARWSAGPHSGGC